MYTIKRKAIQAVDVNGQIVESIVSRYKINQSITLSSGKRSSYYYDIKSLLLCGIDWKQIKDILIQDIKHKFPEVVCVAGQGVGGVALVMRISGCLDYNIAPLIVRDEQKEHGLLKQVEGHCPGGSARCLLVDDVMTTGKSFRKSIKILLNLAIYNFS